MNNSCMHKLRPRAINVLFTTPTKSSMTVDIVGLVGQRTQFHLKVDIRNQWRKYSRRTLHICTPEQHTELSVTSLAWISKSARIYPSTPQTKEGLCLTCTRFVITRSIWSKMLSFSRMGHRWMSALINCTGWSVESLVVWQQNLVTAQSVGHALITGLIN